jgi:hypothetical protein
MIYNVASISLLSVSWKELISPLFVVFFRSYMSVAKPYFWGADLAQPASRPVYSRSTTHSSIAIRVGRSQIVIKKVYTPAWKVFGLVYGRLHST